MTQLSKHFSLKEMTKSATASRFNILNEVTDPHQDNLKALCENILEPLREYYESRPIMISSGYRSPALCEKLGSSKTSQHTQGQAVDFEILGFDNKEVAAHIKNNFEFDQLISEYYEDGIPDSGWIHVSFKTDGTNRKESLIKDKSGYKVWQ